MRRSVVEQDEKVSALPVFQRLMWEDAGWISRLWWVPILALAMALRFYKLTSAAIWGDEGSSLLLSEYAASDLWYHAAHDVHPPLYFFLLRGWIELFGDSIWSIRGMSAIPGVVVVGVGIWLTRQLSTRRAAVLAGILLALLPTAVRYSQEVRMYSLLGVWLLGATLALVYWVRQPARARYLAVYALLMSAGFYTHYFTALCVLVHWAYLGLLSTRRASGPRLITRPAWWVANAVIVLVYLPWLPNLLDLVRHVEQLKVGGDIGWEAPVDLFSLPSMIWQLVVQDEGVGFWPPLFWGFPLLLIAVVSMTAWRDRERYRPASLLALFFLLPLMLVYGVSLISPVFIERYLTVYALGLPILVALAIDRLPTRLSLLGGALFVLFVGAELVGLKNNFTVDEQDQFNMPVEFVNRNYREGDRIVLSDMMWYLSYVYYDQTDAQLQLYTPPKPDGTPTRPNAYGFGTLVDQDGGRIYLDRLSALPADTRRVWLISSTEAPDDFAPLPEGWRELSRQDGGGARARLFVVCNMPQPLPEGCR
ncbi:glycosyltransferase family 39 protein [Pseudomonas extremaustralis]|uniref:glycosyltransferase family 39 protein n=1 Tax=Pseudomonas extremaustralis TaxID=359110 RepID=UPI0021C724CE|nr:glycosyltransferase family 39 protein [Pseudomonas extremaustralis]MDB1109189.1 glycosyltransferase family 39 protein [Pseudomonas extremaustralis]MDG2970325.1 glycosyltransferase family 39 protein [Pseudomonas extremaustralis]UUJ43383.1 glycosyltransferase family 39 protein [Pseudomonas extremaustralis]